jgi:hypothetical protein
LSWDGERSTENYEFSNKFGIALWCYHIVLHPNYEIDENIDFFISNKWTGLLVWVEFGVLLACVWSNIKADDPPELEYMI